MALHAVGYMIDDLEEKYAENRAVIQYLVSVKNDVIRNLDDFKQKEQPQMPFPMPQQQADFTRYRVNVLVDNTGLQGAPVIYETNPMYPNLMGTMERRASFRRPVHRLHHDPARLDPQGQRRVSRHPGPRYPETVHVLGSAQAIPENSKDRHRGSRGNDGPDFHQGHEAGAD